MVFSSIQAYLDQSNWQQQLNPQIGIGHNPSGGNPHLPPPPQPPPPPPPLPPHGIINPGGPGSIRPGSMADRARMANIPLPEAALKCPRCDSTNTKFCYFNNYSLSQPRHFCKTCRRYWTRGGALRNVPVGGGCRRNKRSKGGNGGGSSSKSPDHRQNSGDSTSSVSLTSTNTGSGLGSSILGLTPQLHLPPLRFMSPLNHMSEFSTSELGLNFNSGGNINNISTPLPITSETMNNFGGSGYMAEQWRLQASHMSSLAGLDLANANFSYPFQGINLEGPNYNVNEGGLIRPNKNMVSNSSGLSTQMASVKMEDHNNQEMNLSRQLMGIQGNNNNNDHHHHQYWGNTNTNTNTTGSANWTDLSGFSSSSTTNNPL